MAATSVGDASEAQVSILHRISSIVSSDLSLDEMLGEVVGLAVQATACDACLVYLIDQDLTISSCELRRCRTPQTWVTSK